ncbi:MAG: sigma-70 family RNA polymerase sigma factor [Planctomycetes bacterium]|nr:sigma-70 family RNA polymerase sigma factor [Planctomycetota bacterium]
MPLEHRDATTFLARSRAGDPRAADELFRLVYAELRALAGNYMRGVNPAQTLQPTALVHEAFLRMVSAEQAEGWESRAHFLGVAAKAMRSVLVDHARAKHAQKRGGAQNRVALDGLIEELEHTGSDLVSLDDALSALAEVDDELARVVELRFFGGLTIEETAKVMGISTATVERAWRTARLWLRDRLGGA